jgi:hypothetical protein
MVISLRDEPPEFVANCEAVLRALRPRCKEAPIRLADMAVAGQRILKEHGLEESVLSIVT